MKVMIVAFFACTVLHVRAQEHYKKENGKFVLTQTGASHLSVLPMRCLNQEFPYRTGITFSDSSLIVKPKEYHPAFYGCFDWHSSVHGHWMLVRLLKSFPDMPEASAIRAKLANDLTAENILTELKIFQTKDNKSFERTYGWAWILQLQQELSAWNDSLGQQLSKSLQPLSNFLSGLYIDYLKKLVYPVRMGEHPNLAFGLSLAWDYAVVAKDDSLQKSIHEAATRFYKNDIACPINYEPGGSDFLSPCLEEADLMWRILPQQEYTAWLQHFLPGLSKPVIALTPGEVRDRSDGKLVHLDGLNLSRAWCLYGIAKHAGYNKQAMLTVANKHMEAALPNVASGDYVGEHWLASFAVYALTMQ